MKRFKTRWCRWFGHKFFENALLDVLASPFATRRRYCARCGHHEPLA